MTDDMAVTRARWFKELFTQVPWGIAVIDSLTGRIYEANPAFARIAGRTEDEMRAIDWMSITHPDDVKMDLDQMARLNAGEIDGFQMEKRYVRPDGAVVWIDMTIARVEPENKDQPRHLCMISDITARKESAAAEARAQAMSTTVLDSIDDHILILDASSLRILGANKAFLNDYGMTREQVLARTCHEMTHGRASPCDRTDAPCPVKTIPETATWASCEHVHRDAGGQTRISQISIHPIKDPEGKIVQLVHISRDVTEGRNRDLEALKLEKLKSLGILAGGIAHDFNNILTAILGNISLLKSRTEGDGEAQELVAEAAEACATAKALSTQLLTFSRGGDPVVASMDLRGVLTQAAAFAARGRSSRCVFDLGESPLTVKIDKDQIARVIQNLIINADQAMPNGGDITLRAEVVALGISRTPRREAGRYVRLTVSDQGEGIAPVNLPKLFDPYFSTKGTGRGLGLATAYSIMAKHGGSIAAELAPRTGATFVLHFPLSAAEPAEKPRPAQAAGTGKGKVLIMDDEASLAKVLKRMIEHLGYRAEVVTDGQAALDSYEKAQKTDAPYDAVILDLTVKTGMGGGEAIIKLKELDPKVKAIVSSGYSNNPVMAGYADSGFCGALAKPYTIEMISDVLSSAIALRK